MADGLLLCLVNDTKLVSLFFYEKNISLCINEGLIASLMLVSSSCS